MGSSLLGGSSALGDHGPSISIGLWAGPSHNLPGLLRRHRVGRSAASGSMARETDGEIASPPGVRSADSEGGHGRCCCRRRAQAPVDVWCIARPGVTISG